MYKNYTAYKGWTFSDDDVRTSETGELTLLYILYDMYKNYTAYKEWMFCDDDVRTSEIITIFVKVFFEAYNQDCLYQ